MPLFSYKNLKDLLIPLLGIIVIWFATRNRNEISNLVLYPIILGLIGSIGLKLNKNRFTLVFEDISRSLLMIVGALMLFLPVVKTNWDGLAVWVLLSLLNLKKSKNLEKFNVPILICVFLLYNTFNTWFAGYTERNELFEKSLSSIIVMLLMLCTARRGDERILLWTFGLAMIEPVIIGEIYLHKWETFLANGKNYYAGMGLLSVAMLLSEKKIRFVVLAVLVTTCVIINPSATGRIGIAIVWGIFIIGSLWITRRPILKKISLLLATITIGIVLFLNDVILGILGKDETLTGRTEIWEYAMEWVEKKPIQGWGLEFWRQEGEIITNNARGCGAQAGHSTYLDSLLTGGIVGLLLLLAIMFSSIHSSKRPPLSMLLLLCGPGISLITESRSIPFYISWVTLCLFCGMSYIKQPNFLSSNAGLTNSHR